MQPCCPSLEPEGRTQHPLDLSLVTLSPRAGLNLNAMQCQQVTLQIALADGSLHSRSGIVMRATSEGSDGGFARCWG